MRCVCAGRCGKTILISILRPYHKYIKSLLLCMVTCSKSMDREILPSRLRIWSRETISAVPSRVSLLISILRLNLVLTYGIPPEFRGGVHIFIKNRHTLSGQSRVYRVTQLRTDGVHCRESAGTGPVNLKVVPNKCCLGRSPWTRRLMVRTHAHT